EQYASAYWSRAIPGPVLGREYATVVFLGEHLAAVESHAKVRRMSISGDFRKHDVIGGRIVLVFQGPDIPAPVIRKAEVLPHFRSTVDLTRRDIVSHAVDLVIRKPERIVLRVEVHAHRVAHALCIHFSVLAVPIHPQYAHHAVAGIELQLIATRYVVRITQRDVELVVRTDPARARAVIEALLRHRHQLTLRDHDIRRYIWPFIEELRGREH